MLVTMELIDNISFIHDGIQNKYIPAREKFVQKQVRSKQQDPEFHF